MGEDKFDCIVVGAGPAGTSAAYVMAKAGLDVMVIERGDYPGAKNVMGGVVYAKALKDIAPDRWKEAPLERPITRQEYWIMSADSVVKVGYRCFKNNHANCFSIFRAKFDPWFAKKAEEAGALLFTKQKVEDLIQEDGKVVGIRTGKGKDNRAFADVVILAEGVNAILTEKAGLHEGISSENVALAVKEVIEIPQEKINSRFCLKKDEGVAIYFLGPVLKRTRGMGFIYTNRASVSLGIGVCLQDYKKAGIKPYELLEEIKKYPAINCLINNGEPKEYSAHLIPEGGYETIPELYANGLLVIGDAAGLVNPYFLEGSNLAMTSGKIAAQTVIQAKQKGDFSSKVLATYRKKLNESFVIKDLKLLRHLPDFFCRHSELFWELPEVINQSAKNFLEVDGIPKEEKLKAILEEFEELLLQKGLRWDLIKQIFHVWSASSKKKMAKPIIDTTRDLWEKSFSFVGAPGEAIDGWLAKGLKKLGRKG